MKMEISHFLKARNTRKHKCNDRTKMFFTPSRSVRDSTEYQMTGFSSLPRIQKYLKMEIMREKIID